MMAIRKALLSLGITIFGLTIAFAIMAKDMPGVYPGLSELRAFVSEKFGVKQSTTNLSSLQQLRERNSTLPVEGQGMGAPIGGGATYGILDVFRMKDIFRANDAPTQTHRTRPEQSNTGSKLPTVGETRKSNNVLYGTL